MDEGSTRPEELARELGINGKTLRAWLRAQRPRSSSEHRAPWYLPSDDVAAARHHFSDREDSRPGTQRARGGVPQRERDQEYFTKARRGRIVRDRESDLQTVRRLLA